MKPLSIVNSILFIIALSLAAYLITPTITAGVINELDNSLPTCTFYNEGAAYDLALNQCCYEAVKQYVCQEAESGVKCFIAPDSNYFLLNKKAFRYCQQEGYDVALA